MNAERLRHYINELQDHLTHFKEIRDISEQNYQKLLTLVIDPERKSLLMERHFVHKERREKSIAKMERLYKEALNRLSNLE